MDISSEIDQFRKLSDKLSEYMLVENPAEDIYIFKAKDSPKKFSSEKEIDLTVMALTHGNEVAGIGVLNAVLTRMMQNKGVDFTFAAVLGNTEAARASQRFVHSDLNRSFGCSQVTTTEQQRASLLSEHVLSKTLMLVDLHQTIEPTLSPFFIFPFSLKGYRLARSVSQDTPIVTHWSGGFSKDGMCTDEFVNGQGGVGISLELGQMGFDQKQITFGSQLILSFIGKLHDSFEFADFSQKIEVIEKIGQVWTWAHIEPYPTEQDVELVEGLENFKMVKAGDVIGKLADGVALCSSLDAPIMFPKYIRDPSKPKPSEIIRYLRSSSAEELAAL